MEWFEGFTQCWIPGPTCRVDWSAWAAIASGLAVITALFVGVLPVVSHQRNGRARAHVAGRVYLAQLDVAALWISAGEQLFALSPDSSQHYNAAIGFALNNCRKVNPSVLMADIEHVPKTVAARIAEFESTRLQFEIRVCGNDGVPLVAPDDFETIPPAETHVRPLATCALDLQEAMYEWLFPDTKAPGRAVATTTARRIHLLLVEDVKNKQDL